MKTIEISNLVWKEGKYFVARCLNVEVSSFGKTKSKALANLNEALELYFSDTELSEISAIERPEIVCSVLKYA